MIAIQARRSDQPLRNVEDRRSARDGTVVARRSAPEMTASTRPDPRLPTRFTADRSRSRRSLVAASALLLATACGGRSASSQQPMPSSTTGGDASDAGGDASSGRYRSGPYTCCAEGEGRSCCPPETLPDPSVGRTATCFQYGGVRGACTGAGETLEAKDICSVCCAGLTRISRDAPGDGGACEPAPIPSLFLCSACGDGVCGDGENRCNCPGDCP